MSRSIEDQGSSPLIQPVVEPFQRFIHTEFGAVLIIAFFYTSTISWVSLEVGGAFLVALICANILGIRHPLVYGILGIGGLWLVGHGRRPAAVCIG